MGIVTGRRASVESRLHAFLRIFHRLSLPGMPAKKPPRRGSETGQAPLGPGQLLKLIGLPLQGLSLVFRIKGPCPLRGGWDWQVMSGSLCSLVQQDLDEIKGGVADLPGGLALALEPLAVHRDGQCRAGVRGELEHHHTATAEELHGKLRGKGPKFRSWSAQAGFSRHRRDPNRPRR